MYGGYLPVILAPYEDGKILNPPIEARPSPKRREEAEFDAQPMNLDEQSKEKRGTKRAPERDDRDELKRREHDTSRAKR
ncbi:hypothetical protein DIPPA_13080 [Diplonema papillatum]|nr:hypothetical protein DIPPA_13080 [Diplonema papillatum]